MARPWAWLRIIFGRGELRPTTERERMETLKQWWRRVLVVLRAAPTWLTALALVVGILAEEIGGVLPAGWAEVVAEWSVRVVAWIGAAILIIRRVTPVLPDERGLLPVERP